MWIRLLYNEMSQYDLISQHKSSFKAGDSCINQLLFVIKSFDDGWEVRGAFVDISKAFDKVWHEGLLSKFRLNIISGNLLKIMEEFLSNRCQRVVLNGL